jgi:acetyl esterase/lipase
MSQGMTAFEKFSRDPRAAALGPGAAGWRLMTEDSSACPIRFFADTPFPDARLVRPSGNRGGGSTNAQTAHCDHAPICAARKQPAAAGLSGQRSASAFVIHGGGFFFGSLNTHRHRVSRLAAVAGFTAFSIDYPLAPESTLPVALDDALAAHRWLLEQGFPANRIVLSGDSAGGNLAAATALRAAAEGLPTPAGLHLISAWLDLT